MPKRRLLPVFEFHLLIFLVAIAVITKPPTRVLSATTHVVISEIQISGGTGHTNDEFVELYNPTNSSVDLTNWRLTKKTATGTETNLVASLSGTIPAHGYFLITSDESLASGSADLLYSTGNHLAASNSATLYSDAGVTTTDLVGMGNATAKETSTVNNPVNGGSIERKANSSSTDVLMDPGGSDEFAGNGEDTDNNNADFVQRTVSQPQNSQSAVEPTLASPSPTPDITPTPEPTPSASPEPSVSPSPQVSPSPTVEPSPTLEVSPSPTPSATPAESPTPTPSPSPSESPEPSPTPTIEPSPSPTPSATPVTPSPSATPTPLATVSPTPATSPTPLPSPTPQPTPTIRPFFNGFLFTCWIRYAPIHTRWFTFYLPRAFCALK